MNIEQKAGEFSEISKFSVPITKTKALEFLTKFRNEVIEECAVHLIRNHTGAMSSMSEDINARVFANDIRALKK